MTKTPNVQTNGGLSTVKAVLAAVIRGFVLVTILPAEMCYSIVNHKGPI